MSVHRIETLDRLDRRKLRERRRRLRRFVPDWYRFAPLLPDGTPSLSRVDSLGIILPVFPALLDEVVRRHGWPRSELLSVLARRTGWFYCPELDVFVSWSDYATGLCTLLQNVRGSDTLRPSK